ncbi:MtaA/CmuA family methyltransferase [Calderihabitans maritimus]|uniref:MtaA/CmuA family methyltransferase n=1 Tax=Calderihabitans maritimus TaxID=1246530 RepID=A0A1Z5HP40_9FIRM|nr:MtaA/CmuA family methyltransferase [Calderihabitans maritimus]GAW91065.1 MtaA/CmuA family methyltransferase [Calderihabitans maritimus]
MNSRERFMAALEGLPVDRLPVVSVCQHATYDQMEKLDTYWPEANRKAEDMARLASGAFSILGFDAVRVPFCQTHELEALGAQLKKMDNKNLPSVDVHPYKIGDEAEFPDDFLSRGRIPELIKAVSILKEELGEKVIVIGGIIGPFSIAASLVGITDMIKAAWKKPESVRQYIEIGERAGTTLAKAMIEAGADIIVVEDMMASLDIVSPKIYRELCFPYEKKQVEQLNVPVIIHICGKLDKIIVDVAKTGCAAISVEPVVNVEEALEKFKAEGLSAPLIGAVHPVESLFLGNPEKVKQETLDYIKKGVSMISPGCAVPPGTKIENLKAMVEAVNEAANITQ